MTGQVEGFGTVMLGIAALVIGAWPAVSPRTRILVQPRGILSYSPVAMLGIAVIGVGLVMVGVSVLIGITSITKIVIWVGVVISILGGLVYLVNPKSPGRP